MKRNVWFWLAAGMVLAGAAGFYALRTRTPEVKWRMAPVERGSLRQRISATGTFSALVQVNVGSQVSGTIAALFVDYNSQVVKGQPIAQIEPTLFQAAMEDAQANVAKAEAVAGDARRQLARSKRLHGEKLIADQDLDNAQLVAEKAQGDVMSARAALSRARANLGYCTIKAPVSGVVVSRAVDVGQTVAASFSTPTLFVIAQDLTKMKMLAAIDEADIGQVQPSQKGQFTVDSFPDEQFRGTVSQVRLEPVVSQNVVTYNVQIDVDNADLKLRPGMTANVSILVQAKDDVLKVPSAALRFNPKAFMKAGPDTAGKATGGGGGGQGSSAPSPSLPEQDANPAAEGQDRPRKAKMRRRNGPGPEGNGSGTPGGTPPAPRERANEGRKNKAGGRESGERASVGDPVRTPGGSTPRLQEGQIWIVKDQKPVPIPVLIGINDGKYTEVSGDEVSEGLQVIVGIEDVKKPASGASSPLGGGMRRP